MNYNNNYYNPNAYGYYNNVPTQNYGYQNANSNVSKVLFSFINGVDEARAFIVSPMQTAYLLDNNSSHLFIKRADNMGKYTIEDYILTKAEQENNTYVSKNDFSEMQKQINNLTSLVNSLVKPNDNDVKE